jgi:hypothetical protein
MVARRLLRPRVAVPVLTWAILLGVLPRPAETAPLPPPSPAGPVDVAALEGRLVAAHLVALGLSAEEAAGRVAALDPDERHALAVRLEEVAAGGSAAGALAAAIIIGLLVILVLELMGRRVISRP